MRHSCCAASPWFVHNVPEHSNGVVIAHILKVYVVHLQNNVEKVKFINLENCCFFHCHLMPADFTHTPAAACPRARCGRLLPRRHPSWWSRCRSLRRPARCSGPRYWCPESCTSLQEEGSARSDEARHKHKHLRHETMSAALHYFGIISLSQERAFCVHTCGILTHVEGDSDDVQGHCGVCDAAEWGRLETTTGGKKSPGEDEILTEGMCEHDFQSRVFSTSGPLTLSMFEAFGFRRRRRCRLMRREELCSVELLNLKTRKRAQHFKNQNTKYNINIWTDNRASATTSNNSNRRCTFLE